MESAVAQADEAASGSLAEVVSALARGALIGARGNSGIILAQLLGGVADVLSQPGVELADGRALAKALENAAAAAYRAVADPVEGTILTVARAAADAALHSANRASPNLPGVALAAARAAQEAVSRTPQQLQVLRSAGVVDAGGRGLSVLLDAFDTVLTGRRALPAARRVGVHTVPSPIRPDGSAIADPQPTFEVMYLLDAADDAIATLRQRLAGIGASVAVVGGHGSWNVHVHLDDAGAAVEAGIDAGRPHSISITHIGSVATLGPSKDNARALVAVAAGEGLAALFSSAGAAVVSSDLGYRPSTAAMLHVIREAEAAEVIVLPNDRDVIPVAEAAAAEARASGVRVAVIPTVAQVQGLAAAAVHEPARAFDADAVAMTTAAGHTRHGAVTVATREAVTMAGICHVGDVLGVIEGDFAVIGSDLRQVAIEVIGRMMAAGGEFVTVVTGADTSPDLAEAVVDRVRQEHPEADTVVYEGGQPRYPLLLGVE
jgi:hypothetical protein